MKQKRKMLPVLAYYTLNKLSKTALLFIVWAMVFLNVSAQSSTYKYKKPKYTTSQTKKPTYNVGGTNYIYGETYSTTGKPKVERSYSARKQFLKSKGYSKVPYGYEVDHIIPLSQGGRDDPSNMQLLTKEEHKRKTARERKNTSATKYKKPSYCASSASKSSYKPTKYKPSKPRSSSGTYQNSSYKPRTPRKVKSSYESSSYKPRKPRASRSASGSSTYKYKAPRTYRSSYKTKSYQYKPKRSYKTKSYSTKRKKSHY